MLCSKCGQEIPKGKKFCPNCCSKVKIFNNNLLKPILLIAFPLIIITALAILFFNNKEETFSKSVDSYKPIAVIMAIEHSSNSHQYENIARAVDNMLDPEDIVKMLEVSVQPSLLYEGHGQQTSNIRKSIQNLTIANYEQNDYVEAYKNTISKLKNVVTEINSEYLPYVIIIGKFGNENSRLKRVEWSMLSDNFNKTPVMFLSIDDSCQKDLKKNSKLKHVVLYDYKNGVSAKNIAKFLNK
jgi:predicted nucleic acid-binding Zn ribbon protein